MGNYDAWNVPVSSLRGRSITEAVKALPCFGVLAPSSHNSQPWEFLIHGTTLTIAPNFSRRLTESDKNDRQLYLSLGCAATNILIAADAASLTTESEISQEKGRFIIKLHFSKQSGQRSESPHLAEWITKRVTNRSAYKKDLPPDELLMRSNTICQEQGLTLRLFSEQEDRKKITDFIMDATDQAMSDKLFRKELGTYLQPNNTKSPLGMPCFGMDIPTPVSLIAPTLMKLVNLGKMSASQERKLLEHHTPVFGIIFSEKDTALEWIRSGMAYQQIALEAVQNNLATNPLAAIIQIGNHFQRLQTYLKTKQRPQMFFRLGYPSSQTKHSPRLTAPEVTKHL